MIDANGTEGKFYLQKFVCINTIPFSKIDGIIKQIPIQKNEQ
jgi:hypothetical protein